MLDLNTVDIHVYGYTASYDYAKGEMSAWKVFASSREFLKSLF